MSAKRALKRNLPKTAEYIERTGHWRVDGLTGSGHIRLVREGREYPAPNTPSDWRSDLNCRGDLQRFDREDSIVPMHVAVEDRTPAATYNTREAAAMIGCSERHVMALVRDGKLEPVARPRRGRMTQFDVAEVNRYLGKDDIRTMVERIRTAEPTETIPAKSKPKAVHSDLELEWAKLEGMAMAIGQLAVDQVHLVRMMVEEGVEG